MLDIARFIRDYPDAQERSEEAARQVRAAMYNEAVGEISCDKKRRLLGILLPSCTYCTSDDLPQTSPLQPLENDGMEPPDSSSAVRRSP